MSTIEREQRAPRVLFFGMQSPFAAPSLSALLASGIEVSAVVIPASPLAGKQQAAIRRIEPARTSKRSNLAFTQNTSIAANPLILQIAQAEQLPVWEVKRLAASETRALLASYQADMICVACFSQLVPRIILELCPLGCLNVHPSLLPANRGPVPLFWTFREGQAVTGVTIHQMNEKMDSGAILAQEEIAVTDGMHIDQLEAESAERGGRLLARSVWELYRGKIEPVEQDETQSSAHTFPEDKDFVVEACEWDAKHAYNFMCGISDWERPVELRTGSKSLRVRRATSYSRNIDEVEEYVREIKWHSEREVSVRCRDGWVRVVVEPFVHSI